MDFVRYMALYIYSVHMLTYVSPCYLGYALAGNKLLVQGLKVLEKLNIHCLSFNFILHFD